MPGVFNDMSISSPPELQCRSSSLPRIPYLSEAEIKLTPSLLAAVKQRRTNGRLLNLDRILFYSEPVARAWQAFVPELRTNLHFSPKIRELVILRIAILNRAEYEFFQHAPEALQAGASQAELDALCDWKTATLFSEEERAVFAYTDAMTLDIQVSDAVYTKVAAFLNPQQMVELSVLIGAYNMVSRFLEAIGITSVGEDVTPL